MSDKNRYKEFGQQLTAHQRPLYLYLLTLVYNTADAEDLLQETNRVAWEKFDQLKPGVNYIGWLYKIAHFEVLSYRKKKGRENSRMGDQQVEQLADEAALAAQESGQRRAAMWDCITRLKATDKEMISRRYLEGATVEAVAREMDRPTKSVYHSLGRIRSALLECIERKSKQENFA